RFFTRRQPGRLPGDHWDLQIGVERAARIDDVLTLVDQPFILRHPMLVRAMALNVEAKAITLAKQGAGGRDRDLHRYDFAGLELLFALELFYWLKVSRQRWVKRPLGDPHLTPCRHILPEAVMTPEGDLVSP